MRTNKILIFIIVLFTINVAIWFAVGALLMNDTLWTFQEVPIETDTDPATGKIVLTEETMEEVKSGGKVDLSFYILTGGILISIVTVFLFFSRSFKR